MKLIALLVCAWVIVAPGSTSARAEPAEPPDILHARWCGDLALADVYLDGHGPYTMLVDTGCGVLVLSQRVAEELTVNQSPDSTGMKSANGKIIRAGGRTRIASLRLDTHERGAMDAWVLDLHGIEDALHTRLDGILGLSVFSGSLLTIDYPRRELRLAPGELAADESEPVVLTPTRVLAVHAAVGDHEDDIIMDSGDSGGLSLAKTSGLDLRTDWVVTGATITMGGVDLSRSARLAGNQQVGSITLETPVITQTRGGSRLGTDVMRSFCWTFDVAQQRIRIDGAPRAVAAPPVRGIAAAVSPEAASAKVIQVTPDGPADRAGLQPDDIILALNGVKLSELTCGQWRQTMQSSPFCEMEVKRGQTTRSIRIPTEVLIP